MSICKEVGDNAVKVSQEVYVSDVRIYDKSGRGSVTFTGFVTIIEEGMIRFRYGVNQGLVLVPVTTGDDRRVYISYPDAYPERHN
ncbi:hypothetical protein H6789_02560 [Candidatus Nomurabacteria bacterium]|nr:hypothetical protein [Candidatus Kaiserbacteria bacterium]MCB9815338.1 hypothetical protein [Candidatus Nomurabacteria bacterium]MCB9819561.1 hypothetical protein [Candidatus Nomurabacteria bacterium]